MLTLFNEPWSAVPSVVLDVETTGVNPWLDGVVSFAAVRFERCVPVAEFYTVCDPGRPVPAESTAIHGLTDADVKGKPTIDDVFALPEVKALLEFAQPGAYNQGFDRLFVPPHAFADSNWPWFDPLTVIRVVDRYAKGSGRHKLPAACDRHGVELTAHNALSDARAAGLLLYKLGPEVFEDRTVGEALKLQREIEASEWFRFMGWLSKQPPKEAANG